MACILLDVDGVLHVSGAAIPGAQDAVAELRREGHALRFVTNNSTRPRAQLAEALRVERRRVATRPSAAARERRLAEKRRRAGVKRNRAQPEAE